MFHKKAWSLLLLASLFHGLRTCLHRRVEQQTPRYICRYSKLISSKLLEMSPDRIHIPVASIVTLSFSDGLRVFEVLKQPKTKRQYTLFLYVMF